MTNQQRVEAEIVGLRCCANPKGKDQRAKGPTSPSPAHLPQPQPHHTTLRPTLPQANPTPLQPTLPLTHPTP